MIPQIIDSTMMNTFKSCRQKFFLSHDLGYRPKGVSIDLHAGACFASALHETRKQVFTKQRHINDALVIAQARFFSEWGDIDPPPWKPIKTKDRVWRAVTDYFDQYPPLTDHVQPEFNSANEAALEYTFSIPLEPAGNTKADRKHGFPLHPSGDPFIYCGKFDLLGHINGLPVPLDEKTASGIGPKWADQWNLRSQFIGYIWALNQCNIKSNTAVIRGVAILTNETKLAEAIRPYSNFVVERWHEQLRRDLWHMIDCHEADYWDWNLGEACTSYGNCAFLDVCQSPNRDAWLTDFEVRHWNPLAANPAQDAESLISPSHTR